MGAHKNSDLIIPGLVTNGTAKICCRGLILVLFFTALWSLKIFWIIIEVVINCF